MGKESTHHSPEPYYILFSVRGWEGTCDTVERAYWYCQELYIAKTNFIFNLPRSHRKKGPVLSGGHIMDSILLEVLISNFIVCMDTS